MKKRLVHVVQTHGLGDCIMTLPLLLDISAEGYEIVFSCRDNYTADFIRYIFACLNLEITVFSANTKSPLLALRYLITIAFSRPCYLIICHGVNSLLSRLLSFIILPVIYIAKPRFLSGSQNRLLMSKERGFHKVLYNQMLFFDSKSNIPSDFISKRDFSLLLNGASFASSQSTYYSSLTSSDFIIFSLGSGEAESFKRWPTHNYYELACLVGKNFPSTRVVLVGSPSEKYLAADFCSLDNVVDLIGKLDFSLLLEFYSKAVCLVSHCSGAAHISSIVGTPLVFISGPTSVDITGPYTDKCVVVSSKKNFLCSPCYSKHFHDGCHVNECMSSINPLDVLSAISSPFIISRFKGQNHFPVI
tara:strand:+ start:17276 stop:18355 length:1080 start_codon:yes stop_codon:yes gene_type:complete